MASRVYAIPESSQGIQNIIEKVYLDDLFLKYTDNRASQKLKNLYNTLTNILKEVDNCFMKETMEETLRTKNFVEGDGKLLGYLAGLQQAALVTQWNQLRDVMARMEIITSKHEKMYDDNIFNIRTFQQNTKTLQTTAHVCTNSISSLSDTVKGLEKSLKTVELPHTSGINIPQKNSSLQPSFLQLQKHEPVILTKINNNPVEIIIQSSGPNKVTSTTKGKELFALCEGLADLLKTGSYSELVHLADKDLATYMKSYNLFVYNQKVAEKQAAIPSE